MTTLINTDAEEIKREQMIAYLLGAIQFVHILDFVILMPLGPILMREFQITPSQFGILVSSYTFAAGGANFLASIVSDKFERKTLLQTCFAGFLIGTFLCAIAPNYGLLLGARIITGMFGGVLNAAVFALIADLISPARRGAATGIVMSAFSVSSVIGVPIGLTLAEWSNWHAPFLFIVAIGLIIWAIAQFILPKINNQSEVTSMKETLKNFGMIMTEKKHIDGFMITSLLGFGIFMIIPFLSPAMVKNVGLEESQLKYIYLVGGAATIFSARFIGKLCDRIGPFRIFSIVAVLSSIPIWAVTNLSVSTLAVTLVFSTMFMMTGSGRFIPAMTLLSLMVEPKKRGTFMGLENAFRQLASGVSSLIAGVILYESSDGKLIGFHWLGYIAIFTTLLSWFFARRVASRAGIR
jgi:MFS transporter, DHA1 family, inner membrane transport protein